MLEIMKSLHIDWKDRRLLRDLYMWQEAVVRTVGKDSDPGVIRRLVVRQRFSISPLLFSICAEVIMTEALENMKEGVLRQLVSDLRFADDQGRRQVQKWDYKG